VGSAGLEGLVFKDRVRWGGEFYAAPGGHWRPNRNFINEVGFGGYGHLFTVRLRIAMELGEPPQPPPASDDD
jgi:hypothetical protein